jgi:hypothetical protein
MRILVIVIVMPEPALAKIPACFCFFSRDEYEARVYLAGIQGIYWEVLPASSSWIPA